MRFFTKRLAVLTVLLLAVAGVSANFSTIVDGIAYRYSYNSGLQVTSINGGYKGNIKIPNSILYNDAVYEVKGIASNAFQDCGDLQSIEFHTHNLEEIGSNAFKDCTGLTSIEIPSTVTYIGSKAFEGCSGLTSIEIPASVTSIGGGAFGFCENLISINVSSGNTSYWSSGGLLYENGIGTHLVAVPAGLSPSAIVNEIQQHPNFSINTYPFQDVINWNP